MKIDVKTEEKESLTASDIAIIKMMLKLARKGKELENVKEHFRMYRDPSMFKGAKKKGYSVRQAAYMALLDWDCETVGTNE